MLRHTSRKGICTNIEKQEALSKVCTLQWPGQLGHASLLRTPRASREIWGPQRPGAPNSTDAALAAKIAEGEVTLYRFCKR